MLTSDRKNEENLHNATFFVPATGSPVLSTKCKFNSTHRPGNANLTQILA
jgi:hypothetical protein